MYLYNKCPLLLMPMLRKGKNEKKIYIYISPPVSRPFLPWLPSPAISFLCFSIVSLLLLPALPFASIYKVIIGVTGPIL